MDTDGTASPCPKIISDDVLLQEEREAADALTSIPDSVISPTSLLCDFADEVARGSDAVESLVARNAGRIVPLPWPEGAVLVVDPSVRGWDLQRPPGVRSRILEYCCCDLLLYLIGRSAGLPEGFDLIVLMDVFGRYYAYRGGSDDALYLLSTSAGAFASGGYRFVYPLHCFSGLSDVGLVLGRLHMLIRQGADAGAVARFVVRGHGENVGVARRVPGAREVLRICSLGCLRWRRRDSGGRKLPEAPVPEGDDAIVPLGRVKRGCWPALGVPVFVGVPSGRVFAGDLSDGYYCLVADSLPGFSGVGIARFFENRRFSRRDPDAPTEPAPEEEEERRRLGREKRPPCLADLLC